MLKKRGRNACLLFLATTQVSPTDRLSRDTLMIIKAVLRVLVLLNSLLLVGCAANQMPGFENVYYSYNVPQPLLDRIMFKLRENGLNNARITRDNVGRVRLTGSYRNEDEVDNAFIIVQSIVCLLYTSRCV